MFQKILIANRGEIACRIIKTARRLGIATVAVYSDADREAKHVAQADEAIHIGGSAAAESYLNGDKIIAACQQSQAQAVHPGYGFLSENAAFARQLAQSDIVFIGPTAAAIEAMGDKIASRLLAQKAAVNIIPGHSQVVADAAEAVKICERIGYPVMLKASAGGGGKGMRVAYNRDEAEHGFARASSEALSSFGDARMFIEKYIEQPRHIEIQVLADGHGNVVTLHERECSIQRRHQKVIEEAPSPFMDAETRAAMSAQAIALAKAVNYRSAGTVEMVVDAQRNFYFLEMNTRLQVEHPVTEMITGLDLVEWMIRIANGEKLPLQQAQIAINGWALETRVYAENPFRDFLPSSGRLVRYLPPPQTEVHAHNHNGNHNGNDNDSDNDNDSAATPKPQVRVDDGVEEGDEISRFYDPMIAKVTTWGATRAHAIRAMQQALDEYYIRGVDTNLPLLAAVIAHPQFRSGDLHTGFIEQAYPDGFSSAAHANMEAGASHANILLAVAAWLHHRLNQAMETAGQPPSAAARQISHSLSRQWVVLMEGAYHAVAVSGQPNHWRVACGGEEYQLAGRWRANQPLCRCQVNGEAVTVQVERCGLAYALTYGGKRVLAKVLSPRVAELHAMMPRKASLAQSRFLRSPMPGLLLSLAVQAGARIKVGQQLAVIEAMKMENSLRAEQDAMVEKILVEPGAILQAEQPILEFATAASASA